MQLVDAQLDKVRLLIGKRALLGRVVEEVKWVVIEMEEFIILF